MDKKYLDYQHMRKNKPDTQKSKKRKGDWKQQPLSHFLRERKEKSDGKCEVHSVSVQYGVINQVDFLGRSFAAEDTSNYKLVYPYDVIYTKSPTGSYPYGIVKQNQNPYKVIVSPLYGIFKPQNKYIGYIIQSYFESPNTITKYLAPIIAKGAKNTIQISNELFLSRNVYLPSQPEEQKKIAGFLLSIDKQIEQQRMSLETLMRHKQALLQQLFPQRGKNVPILRLKKYRSNGNWKLILGEKLFECKTTKAGSKQLPILAISQELGAIPRDDINYNVIVSPENLANYKVVRKGDFVISLRSFQGGIEYSEYDGLCSPAYVVLRKNMDIDNTFFKYYFKTKPFVHELNKNLEGIRDGKIIRYSQFAELKIPVPPSKNEQTDIAAIFASLDKLIAANSLKLKSLLAHKKGLMQQLFPQ